MPTYTIGTGADYASWSAYMTFLTSVDAPFSASHIGELREMQNATTSELVWSSVVFGAPTNGEYLEVVAPSGYRHPGYYDATKGGFRNDSGTTTIGAFGDYWASNPSTRDTRFRHLCFGRTNTGSSNTTIVQIRSFNLTSSQPDGKVLFDRCVFFNDSTGATSAAFATNNDSLQNTDLVISNSLFIVRGGRGINIAHALKSLKIYNCVVLWFGSTTGSTPQGIRVSAAPSGAYEIKNCYVASTNNVAGFRPYELTGSPTFANNVSYGGNTSYQADDVTGASNCFADTKPTSDYFDVSNISSGVAFRIAMLNGGTNRLDDQGLDLGSDFSTDIKGNVRGGAWSIGAEEYVNDQPPSLTISTVEYNAGAGYNSVSAPYKVLNTDTVRFTGVATDTEDGTISANIVWEYNRDGGGWTSIGTGASVTWDPPGDDPYQIRATITDSATNSTTATIDVTVASVLAIATGGGTVASHKPNCVFSAVNSRTTTGVKTYTWTQTAGPSIAFSASSPSNTFTAPHILTTDSPVTITFEVEIDDGSGGTDTATVSYSVVVNRQALIYLLNEAMDTAWNVLRTKNTDTYPSAMTTSDGFQLYGFPSARQLSPSYWAGEGGANATRPGFCFEGNNGTGTWLWVLARAYRITGNKRFLRYAKLVGDTCNYVLQKNGPWLDQYVDNNGVLRASIISGNNHNPFASDVPSLPIGDLINALDNDDICATSLAFGLIELAAAMEERGLPETEWGKYLNGDPAIGSQTGVINYFQRHIDLRTQYPDNYGDGGVPEVIPPSSAFHIDTYQNTEAANKYGQYMAHIALNDGSMADYLNAAMYLSEVLGGLGGSYSTFKTALDAEILLNVQYLHDCYVQDGGWGQCYSAGEFEDETLYPDTATVPAVGENRFARSQDCWGIAVSELNVAQTLIMAWNRGFLDSNSTLKNSILNFSGDPPTGIIQEYCDKLANPTGVRSTQSAAVTRYPNILNGSNYVCPRYIPHAGDPYASAAATALSTTVDELMCFGGPANWKVGYDTVDNLSFSGGNLVSSTSVDTSNANYNIGFSVGVTAAGGQPNFYEGDKAALRNKICFVGAGLDPDNGKVSASKLTSVYAFGEVSTLPASSWQGRWNSWQPAYAGWDTSSGNIYQTDIFTTYIKDLLNNWNSISNSPAIDDSDGDGVPDSSDYDDYDPGITSPPSVTPSDSFSVISIGTSKGKMVFTDFIGRTRWD